MPHGQKPDRTTGPDTHFGFRQVPLADKQGLVDDVFHKVARRYDLMNDLMSGGLHRAWKDILVTAVNPPKSDRAFHLLDVAGGTGDIAMRVVEAGGAGTQATALDINADMLSVGRERAEKRGLDQAITFVEGNAEALALPDRILRRLYDRIRHPQRAAHRHGACAKPFACSSRAGISSVWNFPRSMCRASNSSMSFIPSM